MDGRWQIFTCIDCKEEFAFTAEAKLYFFRRGQTAPPVRCKTCYRGWKEKKGVDNNGPSPTPTP